MTRRMDIHRPEEAGALVFKRDETGTVVSVFDKAVNIRVSDGCLISVIRHPAAMTPMSIYCPSLLDENVVRCRVDQSVTIKNSTLAGDGWCVDLNGAKRFQGFAVIEKPIDVNADRLALFEKILNFSGQGDGLLGITGQGEPQNAFARRGREIVEPILSQNRAHLTAHLARFVGLGPGFTPSGDDLICGYLMGEAYSQYPILTPQDRISLWQAAGGTSDAGRTLIWMALMGRFPRFLCLAAAELDRAETVKDMYAMVTNATRYGHTSGTDALTGLLLFFKAYHRHLKHNRRRRGGPIDACPKQTYISG